MINKSVDISYLQLGDFDVPGTASNLYLTDDSFLNLSNGLSISRGSQVDVQFGSRIQARFLTVDGTLINRGTVNGLALDLYSGELQVIDGGQLRAGFDYPTVIGGGLDATLSVDGPSSAAQFRYILQLGSLENALFGGTYQGTVSLSDGATLEMIAQSGNRWIDIQRNGELNIGTGGAIVLTDYINNNNLIRFNNDDAIYFGAEVRGNGRIVSQGAGITELDHLTNFQGTIQANSGSFILGGNINDAGTLRTNGSGEIRYRNAAIQGGNLRGANHITEFGSANSFEGISTFGSTVIEQFGDDAYVYFNNGGVFNNYRPATLDAFTNTVSGVLNVDSLDLEAMDFTTHGVLNINGWMYSRNDMYAGGGSRTYVNTSGLLWVEDSSALELNGALLVNNGVMDGTLNVNYGSLAKGAGVFGTVNVNDGGRFAPGNSPGLLTADSLTMNEGSIFEFELRDAEGIAGIDFDRIHLTDALMLNGGFTELSRIRLLVCSLDASNTAGLANNFDPEQSYSFEFLVADGGIFGFDSAKFYIDTSEFLNSPNDTRFSVTAMENRLFLNFSAVPEPSGWHLVATVLLVFGSRLRLPRGKARLC